MERAEQEEKVETLLSDPQFNLFESSLWPQYGGEVSARLQRSSGLHSHRTAHRSVCKSLSVERYTPTMESLLRRYT